MGKRGRGVRKIDREANLALQPHEERNIAVFVTLWIGTASGGRYEEQGGINAKITRICVDSTPVTD